MPDVNFPETAFLQHLFSEINVSGLSYCVLRNFQTLPKSLGGSDIDIAVLPEDKDEFSDLVIRVAKKHGGQVICDYSSSGRFLRFLGNDGGEWWGAAIDLFWMIEYRGVEYISARQVINNADKFKDIRVAKELDADLIALLKELLSNGKTRKDYLPKLVAQYQIYEELTVELMQASFSSETINLLQNCLSKGSENQENILELVGLLRRDVLRRGLQKSPLAMISNFFARALRLIRPPGVAVAVTGTDGAGKSTLIEAVTPVLELALHSKIKYEHLRPNLFPALGVISGKRSADSGVPVSDPHEQEPSGVIGSLARLAYYSLDYILGYWVKVFPQLVKRPCVYLFDRYYYDILIDQRRMRISLPQWILRTVLIFSPQPNLILCLGTSPEQIYERKPETSLDEVSRQIDELKKLCLANNRAIWIDTGGGIDLSKGEILKAIQCSMSSRK